MRCLWAFVVSSKEKDLVVIVIVTAQSKMKCIKQQSKLTRESLLMWASFFIVIKDSINNILKNFLKIRK
ncbi:hypothetical protein HMPREF3205_01167 [Streptococcus pasteurianus]|nr:hypothetical protein HMPREF3205_01167 [Streptococcus pasteurianus]